VRERTKEIEVKKEEVETILLAVENRIMTADLSLMAPKIRDWFEKKQAII
jgi:hypothetical protein